MSTNINQKVSRSSGRSKRKNKQPTKPTDGGLYGRKISQVTQYFIELDKAIQQYGERVIVFWHSGLFFEIYGVKKENREAEPFYKYPQIEWVSDICGIKKADKKQMDFLPDMKEAYHTYISGPQWKNSQRHIAKLLENNFIVLIYKEEDADMNVLMNSSYLDTKFFDDRGKSKETKRRVLWKTFTPGNYLKEGDANLHKYNMCLWIDVKKKSFWAEDDDLVICCGATAFDANTGEIYIDEYSNVCSNLEEMYHQIEMFYLTYEPMELVIVHNIDFMKELYRKCGINCGMCHEIAMEADWSLGSGSGSGSGTETWKPYAKYREQVENCMKETYRYDILAKHYGSLGVSDDGEGIGNIDLFVDRYRLRTKTYMAMSMCFLLEFLFEHNSEIVENLCEPKFNRKRDSLRIETHAAQQLNIIQNHNGRKYGDKSSLRDMLNKCKTAVGRREFSKIMMMPRTDERLLTEEYELMEDIIGHIRRSKDGKEVNGNDGDGVLDISALTQWLSGIYDVPFCMRKLISGRSNRVNLERIYRSVTMADKIFEHWSHGTFDSSHFNRVFAWRYTRGENDGLAEIGEGLEQLKSCFDMHLNMEVFSEGGVVEAGSEGGGGVEIDKDDNENLYFLGDDGGDIGENFWSDEQYPTLASLFFKMKTTKTEINYNLRMINYVINFAEEYCKVKKKSNSELNKWVNRSIKGFYQNILQIKGGVDYYHSDEVECGRIINPRRLIVTGTKDELKVVVTAARWTKCQKLIKLLTHIKLQDADNSTLQFIEEIKNDIFTIESISDTKNKVKLYAPWLDTQLNSIKTIEDQYNRELYVVYHQFASTLQEYREQFENVFRFVALVDITLCKCRLAIKYNYHRPHIISDRETLRGELSELSSKTLSPLYQKMKTAVNDSNSNSNSNSDENQDCSEIESSYFVATRLRHPIIERIQEREAYKSHDIALGIDGTGENGMLIYGVNAVGKSSLIKSIGMAIFMAQCGMFVPATKLFYKPYHSIFTRIVGNDDIFKAQSTFEVEMNEFNTIVKLADQNSLVLGDEICSSTDTSSAISIFAAGLHRLSASNASFIFATHFHHLVNVLKENSIGKIIIKHISVKYDPTSKKLIYDRVLLDGPGSSSYGIEVCKSIGMDAAFIEYANKIRLSLRPEGKSLLDYGVSRYNSKKVKGICEMCGAQADDIHHLQHQQHADDNGFIGDMHKNHLSNLLAVCKPCHDKFHSEENNHRIFQKVKSLDGTYRVMMME